VNWLVESVPNFSEGRRAEVCEQIRAAMAGVEGVRVLDQEMDANHNRSVFTMVAGSSDALAEAAFAAARAAVERIDLNRHQGEHPRMGAIDVLPFVPIAGAQMRECVELARRAGRRLGEELGLPGFYYEEAASRPERRNLADIRSKTRQFEQFRELIGADPAWTPDFGPDRIHPTAGCVAVGARFPLIAYNVNLDTADVAVARKIAKKVRERDGGLPTVKALGMMMESIGKAQVSMNLCNYTVTSIRRAFDAVRAEATALGAEVHSSEIVGMLPAAALPKEWVEDLKLAGFDPGRQILENRL
jgi:glutamate formiminotransferase